VSEITKEMGCFLSASWLRGIWLYDITHGFCFAFFLFFSLACRYGTGYYQRVSNVEKQYESGEGYIDETGPICPVRNIDGITGGITIEMIFSFMHLVQICRGRND